MPDIISSPLWRAEPLEPMRGLCTCPSGEVCKPPPACAVIKHRLVLLDIITSKFMDVLAMAGW